jgi:hypothetical protein
MEELRKATPTADEMRSLKTKATGFFLLTLFEKEGFKELKENWENLNNDQKSKSHKFDEREA